jgi:endonuclease/exonuclease/phosphatase (EEP) superfamily protein YafD
MFRRDPRRSPAASPAVSVLCGLLITLMGGCATTPSATTWPGPDSESYLLVADERGIEACRRLLRAPLRPAVGALDAANIGLVNWNVKKTSLPNWRDDYRRLTRGKDLILIQEASLGPETVDDLPVAPHWSFAPGYRTPDAVTGVLTLSRVAPLARCSFATVEPLLRTPKATSITQFSLRGRQETLLVVNLHAVNFSFGLGAYKRQFEQIAGVLEGHDGPVILSGDLNTWRGGRMATVEALAAAFGLRALRYGDDGRSLFFGRPLDHIYVRGLSGGPVEAIPVNSSDHNPLSVMLSM